MATHKSAATAAGRVLPDPKATKPEKTAAGSALAQTPKGSGKEVAPPGGNSRRSPSWAGEDCRVSLPRRA
jgi:hypothetical protein